MAEAQDKTPGWFHQLSRSPFGERVTASTAPENLTPLEKAVYLKCRKIVNQVVAEFDLDNKGKFPQYLTPLLEAGLMEAAFSRVLDEDQKQVTDDRLVVLPDEREKFVADLQKSLGLEKQKAREGLMSKIKTENSYMLGNDLIAFNLTLGTSTADIIRNHFDLISGARARDETLTLANSALKMVSTEFENTLKLSGSTI